jgi:ketosteroid isomerase-like protein
MRGASIAGGGWRRADSAIEQALAGALRGGRSSAMLALCSAARRREKRMSKDRVKAIAETLVRYCNEGKEAHALKELYAPDAVSVEAAPMPGGSAKTEGIEGIKGKHAWWNGAHEVHSARAEGPFMHGRSRFGVIFDADVTNRETGERVKMRELGVYTVRNGRIVKEEFFYT